jgi:hypothetical protein
MALVGVASAGSLCSGPDFTDEQIKEIIRRERFARADLLSANPGDEVKIRRQRCHYVYDEISDPLVIDGSNLTYIINQYGVIVNEAAGMVAKRSMKCRNRVLADAEVKSFVDEARKVDRERRANGEKPTVGDPVLPFPPAKFRWDVSRLGCMYAYSERELPEESRFLLTFQVDSYGDVYSAFHYFPGKKRPELLRRKRPEKQ